MEQAVTSYPAIWDETVDVLGIEGRALCAVKVWALYVGDLVQLTRGELASKDGIGKTTMAAVEEALKKHGLKFDTMVRYWRNPYVR